MFSSFHRCVKQNRRLQGVVATACPLCRGFFPGKAHGIPKRAVATSVYTFPKNGLEGQLQAELKLPRGTAGLDQAGSRIRNVGVGKDIQAGAAEVHPVE